MYDYSKNWVDRSLWCCCTDSSLPSVCRWSMELIFVHPVTTRRAAFWMTCNLFRGEFLAALDETGQESWSIGLIWDLNVTSNLYLDRLHFVPDRAFRLRFAYNAPQSSQGDGSKNTKYFCLFFGPGEPKNSLNQLVWSWTFVVGAEQLTDHFEEENTRCLFVKNSWSSELIG